MNALLAVHGPTINYVIRVVGKVSGGEVWHTVLQYSAIRYATE